MAVADAVSYDKFGESCQSDNPGDWDKGKEAKRLNGNASLALLPFPKESRWGFRNPFGTCHLEVRTTSEFTSSPNLTRFQDRR